MSKLEQFTAFHYLFQSNSFPKTSVKVMII